MARTRARSQRGDPLDWRALQTECSEAASCDLWRCCARMLRTGRVSAGARLHQSTRETRTRAGRHEP
eukprot:10799756-Alexandrium_andersonii.AAC.1